MTQKEIRLLHSYIINNRYYMEEEIRTLQSNLRFRKIGIQDCIELASAIERYEMFIQVTQDILLILNLKNP